MSIHLRRVHIGHTWKSDFFGFYPFTNKWLWLSRFNSTLFSGFCWRSETSESFVRINISMKSPFSAIFSIFSSRRRGEEGEGIVEKSWRIDVRRNKKRNKTKRQQITGLSEKYDSRIETNGRTLSKNKASVQKYFPKINQMASKPGGRQRKSMFPAISSKYDVMYEKGSRKIHRCQ